MDHGLPDGDALGLMRSLHDLGAHFSIVRQLVKIINEASVAIELKKQTLLEPILNQLFEYARLHFSHEEARMAAVGFPDLESHAAEHHEFFQHVSDLYSRFLEGNPDVVAELPTFLRAWLVKHIQGTDRNYVPYLLPR